ncbi:PstS family phosphate ABC transporter substrate-binding protein [Haloplanus sp.]|uniref:PstS family phosphate ABC transporter substrate-binding protein n=1 Tax=Haloplanus sp. TaxID=1961696 RepID=UPI002628EE8D|nr:PstS family phosphate ABC transporter substrate-binding protein [Haloplanus sp.]
MTETSANGSTTRRRLLAAVGSAGVIGMAGCTQSGGGDGDGDGGDGLSGTIDIAGSSTVFPVATAMAERFESEHSGVDINIQSTGSGGGFANHFCPGRTDFNNASRPIQSEEEETCSGNGVTPVELTVATDALTVVVNNEADWVDCMTTDELARLWSAEDPPTMWSEVNADWPDQELELYGPTDASGTYDYFIESILGEEGPGHRQDYSATEQDRTIIQGVEGSEGAIGYLGFAYYSQNTDRVKAVGIDDGDGCVEPSLGTARTGEYTPLSRPLFTYPKQGSLSEDHVAEFARFWLENSTSEEIIADEVGYVPLSDDAQSEAMERLETAIENAQG